MMKSLRMLTGKTVQGGGGTVRWLLGAILFLAVTVVVPDPGQGAIYFYVDENGVQHFSNVPGDPRYRLKDSAAGVPRSGSVNRFDSLIHNAARRHEVDPLLIKAIVHAESGFDPYAVSEKGAKGLMQLMPETAREMQVVNPFDPEANILGGTRFLKKNLDRFNNDLELSLAAYNAGPGRVQATGRIPGIRETQDFIKRVLEFYQHYKAASPPRYGVRSGVY
jgi:soluble lytic murein transglycosylase-like protein